MKYMNTDLDVIDWYIKVLEDGVNTKDLCIEMVKTKNLNKAEIQARTLFFAIHEKDDFC